MKTKPMFTASGKFTINGVKVQSLAVPLKRKTINRFYNQLKPQNGLEEI